MAAARGHNDGRTSSRDGGGRESGQEKPQGCTAGDEFRRKALAEFRCRMEDAIRGDYLLRKSRGIDHPPRRFAAGGGGSLRDVSLWGVPLLPSKGHGGTDVVLMKFLRANNFRVAGAFEMLRRTLIWRAEFGAMGVFDDDSGSDDPGDGEFLFGGTDRQGRLLCFNVYGALDGKSEEEKRDGFLRSRVRSMERCVRRLEFRAGAANSFIQITDLKNLRDAGTKEVRAVCEMTVFLIQQNYPELVHRNIIVNVPFWYYTLHSLVRPFMPRRTRSKFLLARPKRVTQTLLKFIAPENIPVRYGGFRREHEDEFSPSDKLSEVVVKGGATKTIQFPISEAGVTAVWDVAVAGSEAEYKEEFVPDDECSYRVLLRREKKVAGKSVRNSFYIGEPGRIVITIDGGGGFGNRTVFYRYKTKPTVPMYFLLT